MNQVQSIVLSIGQNPHVVKGRKDQSLTLMHFHSNATTQEVVHCYHTPPEGAVIVHEVPTTPTQKGVREPHSQVYLEGNTLNFSTTQIELNVLTNSIMAASD